MFSEKVMASLKNSSWIRAMFEEGEKLRKTFGKDNVFDFSLGNPDPEPPGIVKDTLRNIVLEDKKGLHRYMSNAGFVDVRTKIADSINSEAKLSLGYENIIMTCGAAGGLNVVLKTLLNPGEEVIVFSPYFVEYGFYIDNHGGKTVVVPTDPDTFFPDANVLSKHISKKTKAIIINSPNNPTGAVYSQETLEKMEEIISHFERVYNSKIFVISDEPYSKIVYDNTDVPSVLKIFKNSVVVNSFSKSLALPGERIGYIAVNDKIEDVKTFLSGLVFSNRILGYVNAPALFQKVISEAVSESVDIEIYKKRRDLIYNHITALGFSCVKPEGAFYLFPKSLVEDDVAFVKSALKYNLLLVPGKGFGCPGHFRISYCVSLKTIERSLPAFSRLYNDFR